MGTTRRQSGTLSASQTAEEIQASLNQLESPIVGVDRDRLARSQTARSEVFRGAYFKNVNVPDTAAVGGLVTVSGEIAYDNLGRVLSPVTVRVRIESPALDRPITRNVADLKHGQSERFVIEVPVRGTEGSLFPLTVIPQNKGTGGWRSGNEQVFRVEVVSQEEKETQEALSVLPPVALGAGGGLFVSQITGSDPLPLMAGGGLAGAGLSAAGFSTDFLPSLPSFPTTKIAVVGGAALALSVLLQSSGASEVLGPAAEAAGGAIDQGRQAVEQVAQRQ